MTEQQVQQQLDNFALNSPSSKLKEVDTCEEVRASDFVLIDMKSSSPMLEAMDSQFSARIGESSTMETERDNSESQFIMEGQHESNSIQSPTKQPIRAVQAPNEGGAGGFEKPIFDIANSASSVSESINESPTRMRALKQVISEVRESDATFDKADDIMIQNGEEQIFPKATSSTLQIDMESAVKTPEKDSNLKQIAHQKDLQLSVKSQSSPVQILQQDEPHTISNEQRIIHAVSQDQFSVEEQKIAKDERSNSVDQSQSLDEGDDDSIEVQPPSQENIGVKLSDFRILEEVGAGSFGIVKLVQQDNFKYALKELSKQKVIEDESNLYFLMEHVPNGSLSSLLRQQNHEKLPLELARFYTAWLVLALEYLHSFKVVHRDLKPQNILIDDDLYLKIVKQFLLTFVFQIDFGDSKQIDDEEQKQLFERNKMMENRASRIEDGSFFGALRENDSHAQQKVREGTFVGTPLYVAPEMLDGNFAGKFTDLWALGCMVYQFHVGSTPFQGKSYDSVFQKILERDLQFPRNLDSNAKDLIDKLLDYTPENRIGMNGYQELKSHPYFKGIDFEKLAQRKLTVPCQEVFGGHAKTLQTTDFDETEATSAIFEKSTSSKDSKNNGHQDPSLVPDLVQQYHFDECCRSRIDIDQLVMEGWVKVRRRLFFYKRRQLFLLEDGSVYIVKQGHINNEFKLSKHTEISYICEGSQNKFLISTTKTYEYIECDTPDMAQTWVNILLNIRRMNIENQKQKRKVKASQRCDQKKPRISK